MGAIERILSQLERHTELVYRVSGGTITVEPSTANGFTVSMTEEPGKWVVAFDGWHEHFTSEDEAINCFFFGLTDRCRLRVHSRGTFAYRWVVEVMTDAGWREDSVCGLLIFPFWRRYQLDFRQNAFLGIADPENAADRARN